MFAPQCLTRHCGSLCLAWQCRCGNGSCSHKGGETVSRLLSCKKACAFTTEVGTNRGPASCGSCSHQRSESSYFACERVRSLVYTRVGTIGGPATNVPVRYGSCSHQRSEMVSHLNLHERHCVLTKVGMIRGPATSIPTHYGSCSHQGFVLQAEGSSSKSVRMGLCARQETGRVHTK